jgi:hypothetical protein
VVIGDPTVPNRPDAGEVESDRLPSRGEARYVRDRCGLPDDSRDDAPTVAELRLDRVEPAIRNDSREASDDVENGIRTVEPSIELTETA